MTSAEVRPIVQSLVQHCHLTVLIRHTDGTQEQEGNESAEVVSGVWASVDRLWHRMEGGLWWGVLQDVLIQDCCNRTWILHVYGSSAQEGLMVAVGPVGSDKRWTHGQVLQMLAPHPPEPRGVGRTLSRVDLRGRDQSVALWNELASPVIESVRIGDVVAYDSAIEVILGQITTRLRPEKNERMIGFLAATVSMCERVSVSPGGLDPLEAESIASHCAEALESAVTSREATLALVPLLREFVVGVSKVELGTSAPVRTMVRYLAANLHRAVTLGETAAKVHLSPNYAGALLKLEHGEGFTATLRRLRIERAKVLLVATQDPIKDIALRVGFRESEYFSKLFQGRVGCSPRDFRRNRGEIVELSGLPSDEPALMDSVHES